MSAKLIHKFTFSTGLLFQLFLFHQLFFSSSQKQSGLAITFFKCYHYHGLKNIPGTNISNAFVWFFLKQIDSVAKYKTIKCNDFQYLIFISLSKYLEIRYMHACMTTSQLL